ncbi:PAS domain S-box protein [Halobellus sp. EA9]|uniref:PAS domain S-box protein n=1 Tax=Halobellus sp. EA9 TaxID=3421647 RepID=UPI003EBD70AE
MTAGAFSPTVLVDGDDALLATVRSAVADRTPAVRVVGPDSTQHRSTDCIVARTAPASVEGDVARGGPDVVLYPRTPDDDLARRAAGAAGVRYLPASIDTDGADLLADAIDAFVSVRERGGDAGAADEASAADATGLIEEATALAGVGGWAYDPDAETVTWTAETYRLHGVPESFEPTPERAVSFYHPDDRDAVRADVERAVSGEPFDATYRLRRADGELRWVRSKAAPVVEDGSVVAVRGAFQDVTEREKRENTVRRFKRAIEAAGHAIFITDRSGEIEYVNPAFEEVTGYRSEEAIGRDPSILKSGQMDRTYYSDLWSTILSGEVWSEPIVNARKSGEHYHASETIAPITGVDGTIEGFVAIQTDVTEQVRTRERLETFEEIVNRLDDPIMLQNRDGTFRVLNDAVAEYADRSKAELIDADEFGFMDDVTARRIQREKGAVLDSESTITYEVTPTFPTKGTRSVITTRYPHYDGDGNVDGTVAICRDVTERAEREHQLRVLDRILRHNLYNKMNLVLGHAELLEERTDGRIRESARKIREAGDALVELADKERRIVDLLTDESERQRLALRPIITETVAELRAAHPDREIALDCAEPFEVCTIPELRDALAELLRNAVVHTEPDADVAVRVERADGRVVVTVADTGPGIPEMEQQAAHSPGDITPLFHGSGLGLQFVYHVVQRSGGALRFGARDVGSLLDADAIGASVSLSLVPQPNEEPNEGARDSADGTDADVDVDAAS